MLAAEMLHYDETDIAMAIKGGAIFEVKRNG